MYNEQIINKNNVLMRPTWRCSQIK